MNLFNVKKMMGDFRVAGLGWGGDFEKVLAQISDFL